MLDLTIRQAQQHFIDTRKIRNRVERGRVRALTRGGGAVRLTARRSMRRARRKRKSEMNEQEQWVWNIIVQKAEQRGEPAPKRPYLPSNPGEPPRFIPGSKLLRDHLYYVYDRSTHSVIVGPAKLNGTRGTDVPRVLEEGGVNANGHRIEPRPYMRPAYDRNEQKIVQFWKDSIK